MLGSKTLRLATVTAVASLLALPAFVGEAHAAAKAFSSLHVEDFIASECGTQFDQGDFDNLGITNSVQNSATLTGFPDRTTVWEGKSGSVRVTLGGRRIVKKKIY